MGFLPCSMGRGRMAKSVKGLFCTCEDVSIIPRTHVRASKHGDIAFLIPIMLGTQRQEDPWDLLVIKSSLISKFQVSEG